MPPDLVGRIFGEGVLDDRRAVADRGEGQPGVVLFQGEQQGAPVIVVRAREDTRDRVDAVPPLVPAAVA